MCPTTYISPPPKPKSDPLLSRYTASCPNFCFRFARHHVESRVPAPSFRLRKLLYYCACISLSLSLCLNGSALSRKHRVSDVILAIVKSHITSWRHITSLPQYLCHWHQVAPQASSQHIMSSDSRVISPGSRPPVLISPNSVRRTSLAGVSSPYRQSYSLVRSRTFVVLSSSRRFKLSSCRTIKNLPSRPPFRR